MDTIKSITFLLGCLIVAGSTALIYPPAGGILLGVTLIVAAILTEERS